MDDINLKIDQLLNQLSQEGLLNDQFQQLLQLQDDANPNFVKVRLIISGAPSKHKASIDSNCWKLWPKRSPQGKLPPALREYKPVPMAFA